LQAADMLAYRLHQISYKLGDDTYAPVELDRVLLQGLFKSLTNSNPALAELIKRNMK